MSVVGSFSMKCGVLWGVLLFGVVAVQAFYLPGLAPVTYCTKAEGKCQVNVLPSTTTPAG